MYLMRRFDIHIVFGGRKNYESQTRDHVCQESFYGESLGLHYQARLISRGSVCWQNAENPAPEASSPYE